MRKLEVKFDKPINVSMYILDISPKHVCMNFITSTCYRYIMKNVKLCVLILTHISCPTIYDIMKRDIAKFDTSDYPTDNAYGIPLVNKKISDLMKNKNNGAIIIEFVGLWAKMYEMWSKSNGNFHFLESILFIRLHRFYPLQNSPHWILYTYASASSNPQNTSGTRSLG